MANFCTNCGRPLEDGEICNCQANRSLTIDFTSTVGFLEGMKNRMGIGDPELNKGDAYEKGKRIVPDCVKPSEGEVPVRQYEVAKLRNRILGIPYNTATGRIQVTNKRIIFRAPGRWIAGRTTLQHEFALDEIAGIEARREFKFNFWDFIIGLIVTWFGGVVMTWIVSLLSDSISRGEFAAAVVLSLVFGIAGCIPFFTVKKKWLLKLLCLGGGGLPMLSIGILMNTYSKYRYYNSSVNGTGICGKFLIFLAIVVAIFIIFSFVMFVVRPNLVLLIKTKQASEAVSIRCRRFSLHGIAANSTGYSEIIPADDAEKSIKELWAVVKDVQELGAAGVEKWRA